MRQSERDAGQGRSTDVPPSAGGLIDIRELTERDIERIGGRLPLHRLPDRDTYLVAWEGDEPLGQAHIAWARTRLGVPEVQDVWVREDVRRRGVATTLAHAAERVAAERGHARISLSHGISNEAARQLYEALGYRNAGLQPEPVKGVVRMRNGPVEVDDTLIYLVKELPVDSGASRSS